MENKHEVDMTSGNLFSKLFFVSLPLIFSGILQLLYNAADLIVCGSFGSNHAVGAISATNALINLIVNLFLGLSIGANVAMAKTFGQQDKDKAKRIVYTSIIFAITFGILVGLFGILMAKTFLEWMGTTDDVIELSTTYLRIYFLGLPASMIYNFGSSLLRATGDTKRPFIYLAIAGVINVLLNLFFVLACDMDVDGVAIATITAQYISAIMIMICIIRNKGFISFRFKEIRFYAKEALEIIKIGIPAGIQGVIFSFSNVIIQSSVNSLGTNVMDGNGASSSLEGFVYVAMNSVAHTSVAFISANVGARKLQNIKKIVLYALSIVLLMNLVFGGIILLFQNGLLGLYIRSSNQGYEEALRAAKGRLILICCTYFLCGFMDTLAFCLRGIGYSFTPMLVTLGGIFITRMVWIFSIFNTGIMHNITGIFISYPLSWIITAIIHMTLFIILYKRKLNGELVGKVV